MSRRQASLAGAGLVVGVGLAVGQLSPANTSVLGRGLVVALVMLSLVLLSGYGGLVSLCQLTFAGFGAYAMGKTGGGVVGLACAVLLPAAVGALVALSVVRLRGIFLALATLAFAQAMDKVFFLHALGYGGTLAVPRPFGLSDDGAFVVFLAMVLAVGCVGVLELRRRAFGRRLVALNDSPAACATMGVNSTMTKLVVFTVSAGIAGLGGALLGGLNGQVSNNDFLLLNSCVLLLLATLGGLYTPSGVVVTALLYAMFPVIQNHLPDLGQVAYLFTGLGVLMLGRNRYGLGGQLAEAGERLRGLRPQRLEVARAAG